MSVYDFSPHLINKAKDELYNSLIERKSRLLIVSSSLLLIPTIYAFYNGLYLLSVLTLCETVSSVIYWMEPEDKNVRNTDLVIAKTGFVVYTISSGVSTEPLIFWNVFQNGIVGTVLSSCLANALYYYNIPFWVPAHIILHFFRVYMKVLAIGLMI